MPGARLRTEQAHLLSVRPRPTLRMNGVGEPRQLPDTAGANTTLGLYVNVILRELTSELEGKSRNPWSHKYATISQTPLQGKSLTPQCSNWPNTSFKPQMPRSYLP